MGVVLFSSDASSEWSCVGARLAALSVCRRSARRAKADAAAATSLTETGPGWQVGMQCCTASTFCFRMACMALALLYINRFAFCVFVLIFHSTFPFFPAGGCCLRQSARGSHPAHQASERWQQRMLLRLASAMRRIFIFTFTVLSSSVCVCWSGGSALHISSEWLSQRAHTGPQTERHRSGQSLQVVLSTCGPQSLLKRFTAARWVGLSSMAQGCSTPCCLSCGPLDAAQCFR